MRSSSIPAGERASTARVRAGQTGQALINVLQRLVPVARRIVGVVRVLAIMALVAAVAVVFTAVVIALPTTPLSILATLVLLAILALPAGVLWLFHGALREVLALPDWLRSSPEMARTHGAELAGLVRGTSGADKTRPPGRKRSILRDLVRSGRLLLEAHGDLPDYGAVLRLVNVPFLVAAGISFCAAITLIVFALCFVPVGLVVGALT